MKIDRGVVFVDQIERSRPGFVKVRASHSASIQAIEVEVRAEQQPRIGDRLWVAVTTDESP